VHLLKLAGRAAGLQSPLGDRQVHLDAAAEIRPVVVVERGGRSENLGHDS